jgi:hypothetical protein
VRQIEEVNYSETYRRRGPQSCCKALVNSASMRLSCSFPSLTSARVFLSAATIPSACSGCLTRCLAASCVMQSKIASFCSLLFFVIHPFYRAFRLEFARVKASTLSVAPHEPTGDYWTSCFFCLESVLGSKHRTLTLRAAAQPKAIVFASDAKSGLRTLRRMLSLAHDWEMIDRKPLYPTCSALFPYTR